MAVLYTAFFIFAPRKSYELIYLIPDKVMRWANAQGAQTDDANLKNSIQTHGNETQQGNLPGSAVNIHKIASGNPPVPGGKITPQG
jgi:hypothetical protein